MRPTFPLLASLPRTTRHWWPSIGEQATRNEELISLKFGQPCRQIYNFSMTKRLRFMPYVLGIFCSPLIVWSAMELGDFDGQKADRKKAKEESRRLMETPGEGGEIIENKNNPNISLANPLPPVELNEFSSPLPTLSSSPSPSSPTSTKHPGLAPLPTTFYSSSTAPHTQNMTYEEFIRSDPKIHQRYIENEDRETRLRRSKGEFIAKYSVDNDGKKRIEEVRAKPTDYELPTLALLMLMSGVASVVSWRFNFKLIGKMYLLANKDIVIQPVGASFLPSPQFKVYVHHVLPPFADNVKWAQSYQTMRVVDDSGKKAYTFFITPSVNSLVGNEFKEETEMLNRLMETNRFGKNELQMKGSVNMGV